ncbi:MAG: hypothetical protein FJ100_16810 [Deltaproteobacteria bacterium]|nr:hypothetical protein [Deltaproteobacteria bacterium]
MPAPQSATMKNLAKLAFKSHAIKLPVDWKQPQGDPDAKQYSDAFKPSERMAVPDPSKLFVPASVNKYHVDTVKQISEKFEKYIDGICDAICQAWSTYHSTACLTTVMIAGPTASGGMLVGAPLTPLILASGPKASANEAKYTRVIATVVGTGMTSWQSTVKVAGMPWYPAFAAFPGPMAPPTPNVPCPLVALVQVNASMQDAALKGQMVGQLGDPKAQHHQELFDSVAKAVAQCFTVWTASTQVTNVLGFGPIPTFAPPFVPVGPVVGGMGNQTPGGMT